MGEVKQITYQPGASVVLKGARNEGYFYIVQKGILAIQSQHEFSEKELSRFEAGDSFGLVSALTRNPFLATIVAKSQAVVLRMALSQLGSFLKRHRNICLKMVSMYTKELRALDRYLADINEHGEFDNQPEKLYSDAMLYQTLGEHQLGVHALYSFIDWVKNNPNSPGAINLEQAKAMLNQQEPDYKPRGQMSGSNEIKYRKGDIIFVENEPSGYFYVVKDGSVKVAKLVKDAEFILGVLGPGEIFGEMSLVDNKPRFASAIAFEDCTLLRLSASTFVDEVGEQVLYKIFTSLARRIWISHQRVAVLRIPDAVARLYLFLESLIKEDMMKTPDAKEQSSYTFNFSCLELQKMCGLIKVSAKTLEPFLKDPNLELGEETIRIDQVRKLKDSILMSTSRIRRNLSKATV